VKRPRASATGVRPRAPRHLGLLAAAALLAAAHSPALADSPLWELDFRLGDAWDAPLPIVLRQRGQDDLRLTARWRTDALKIPFYYSYRVARWRGGRAWALDLTHHKLYLENPPPEVQDFCVSHGYNLLTLQRLVQRGGWRFGGAAGVVVTHPESEVRGRRFGEHGGLLRAGYYVSGPTAGALVGATRALRGPLRLTSEAKLTLSYASVPLAGGSARVPDLAVHVTVGLGWAVGR